MILLRAVEMLTLGALLFLLAAKRQEQLMLVELILPH